MNDRQITFIIEPESGRLTVEGASADDLEDMLGPAEKTNCGKPAQHPVQLEGETGDIRVHRIYHESVVDGPGIRSVLQVQGCPIRCAGCYVPETHSFSAGTMLSAGAIYRALVDPAHHRDGVTILGGEPLAQAEQLIPLAETLRDNHSHLTIYTGYTVEATARHGTAAQRALLLTANMVIDGPFVRSQRAGAGEYRGSRNQNMRSWAEVGDLLRGGAQWKPKPSTAAGGARIPVLIFSLTEYRANGGTHAPPGNNDFLCAARIEYEYRLPRWLVIRGLGIAENDFRYIADEDVFLLRDWPEHMSVEDRCAINMEDCE